jgi:ribose/xylose/arabinose/galactoside ABC-type transport system permease subunit
MIVVVAIAWVIFHRSYLGRWLYAVGINARAARVSGVPTRGDFPAVIARL